MFLQFAGPCLACFTRLALLALLAGVASQAAAETGPDGPEGAFCRSSATVGCECSFGSLETTLTFGQAADVVLIYYRDFPDDRYSGLLQRFLRQCADAEWRPAPAVRATIGQDQDAPAATPSRRLGRAGGARP